MNSFFLLDVTVILANSFLFSFADASSSSARGSRPTTMRSQILMCLLETRSSRRDEREEKRNLILRKLLLVRLSSVVIFLCVPCFQFIANKCFHLFAFALSNHQRLESHNFDNGSEKDEATDNL